MHSKPGATQRASPGEDFAALALQGPAAVCGGPSLTSTAPGHACSDRRAQCRARSKQAALGLQARQGPADTRHQSPMVSSACSCGCTMPGIAASRSRSACNRSAALGMHPSKGSLQPRLA